MNKRGFTLVEIIGVLTILALVILVAFPNILGAMQKTNEQMNEATETLLITNAKNYWSENVTMIAGTNYCVSIQTLISENYTKTPISTVDTDYAEELATSYYVKATKVNNTEYKWTYSLTKNPGMTCD